MFFCIISSAFSFVKALQCEKKVLRKPGQGKAGEKKGKGVRAFLSLPPGKNKDGGAIRGDDIPLPEELFPSFSLSYFCGKSAFYIKKEGKNIPSRELRLLTEGFFSFIIPSDGMSVEQHFLHCFAERKPDRRNIPDFPFPLFLRDDEDAREYRKQFGCTFEKSGTLKGEGP